MKPSPSRRNWPLKTLIEILPVFIALTALFSYTTIRHVTPADLVTPLSQVLGHVPVWVGVLMGLIAVSGTLGMIWLIYIFCRAPVSTDGGHETDADRHVRADDDESCCKTKP